ncbi:17755_t:CDS:1 [Cetraspora pellucida]|uniref:17755_t:CDS:1 n=1 Tax=Cetraspora pellucida TaxID=1433469 RepID=A0ACA9KBZ4_9GLOM|nr:17755_t:CDS:1 [Cetraspora pellucida]
MSNYPVRSREKQSINESSNSICRFEYITLEGFKTIKNQINGSRNSKDPLMEAAKIGVYIETLNQILSEFGFQYQKHEENGQYTIFDKNKNKEKRYLIHDNLDNEQKYDEPIAVPFDELPNDGDGIQEFEGFTEMHETEILTKMSQYNVERMEVQKYKGGKNRLGPAMECQAESTEEVELCNGYAIGYDYYNYL